MRAARPFGGFKSLEEKRAWGRDWARKRSLTPEQYAIRRLWKAADYQKNAEIERKRKREHYHSHPEIRERQARLARLRRHGLKQPDYDAMHIAQDGLCAICLTAKVTDIDHCHKTNKVRGLLCGKCNRAIGLFHDNADNIIRAGQYVRLHADNASKTL